MYPHALACYTLHEIFCTKCKGADIMYMVQQWPPLNDDRCSFKGGHYWTMYMCIAHERIPCLWCWHSEWTWEALAQSKRNHCHWLCEELSDLSVCKRSNICTCMVVWTSGCYDITPLLAHALKKLSLWANMCRMCATITFSVQSSLNSFHRAADQ